MKPSEAKKLRHNAARFGQPVPVGFVEDVAQGLTISALAKKHGMSWRSANLLAASGEVLDGVEALRNDYRAATINILRAAQKQAAERLVELICSEDDKVALDAVKFTLGLQGHVVRERQEVTITSPQAAMSDDELEARLQALRAKHSPPVVITLATPDPGNVASTGPVDEG